MRLFLCEKRSQGREIAKVLRATRRGEGCMIGIDSTVTGCMRMAGTRQKPFGWRGS